MIIKLYGGLRQKAGAAQLPAAGETVCQALQALCRQYPALQDAIFAGERLRPHVRVMINGRDIELDQGLATPLTETDQIAVFPPIAGG